MKHIITAEDLIQRQKSQADMVVFDCRFTIDDPNYPREAYLEEHILGAFFIDLEKDLSSPKSTHGGNHPFADPTVLKELLESFGVSNATTIVLYDHGDFSGPARMLVQLLHIGLSEVYILDGGIEAYKAAGGKTSQGEGPPKPNNGHLSITVNNEMLVTMHDVKQRLYQPGVIIVDSRSPNRYLGLEEPLYRVAGHIPSAKNYYAGDVLHNCALKDSDFLKEHFKGLLEADEIILSCGSGVSACVNSLALRQLGVDHKIYVGSYSDWLSYPENEVKQGQE